MTKNTFCIFHKYSTGCFISSDRFIKEYSENGEKKFDVAIKYYQVTSCSKCSKEKKTLIGETFFSCNSSTFSSIELETKDIESKYYKGIITPKPPAVRKKKTQPEENENADD